MSARCQLERPSFLPANRQTFSIPSSPEKVQSKRISTKKLSMSSMMTSHLSKMVLIWDGSNEYTMTVVKGLLKWRLFPNWLISRLDWFEKFKFLGGIPSVPKQVGLCPVQVVTVLLLPADTRAQGTDAFLKYSNTWPAGRADAYVHFPALCKSAFSQRMALPRKPIERALNMLCNGI